MPTALYGLANAKTGYDPTIIAKIERLRYVKHVESSSGPNASPIQPDGQDFVPSGPNINLNIKGSLDGLFVDQDRIAIKSGRMLQPARPNELVVSPAPPCAIPPRISDR